MNAVVANIDAVILDGGRARASPRTLKRDDARLRGRGQRDVGFGQSRPRREATMFTADFRRSHSAFNAIAQ